MHGGEVFPAVVLHHHGGDGGRSSGDAGVDVENQGLL